jgi:hypothetical protein
MRDTDWAGSLSEIEESFFREGDVTSTPAIETFDDLDADYQPSGFWSRVVRASNDESRPFERASDPPLHAPAKRAPTAPVILAQPSVASAPMIPKRAATEPPIIAPAAIAKRAATEPPIMASPAPANDDTGPAPKIRAATDPSFWSPGAASFFAASYAAAPPADDAEPAEEECEEEWEWQIAIARARTS